MVVNMARHMWRTGVPLKVLVEYGMLGLRIAAQPPRPSKTKKGAMVGFDPSTGNRFSTYARSYAAKEMRAAIANDVYEPLVKPEFGQKATVEFEEWSTAESLKGPLPPILRHLRERRKSPPCILPLTLWHPPTWAKDQYKRPVKLRNYLKCPATPTEWANKDAFYGVWADALKSFEALARDGREGLEDEDERWGIENNFMIASLLRNHAFTGKEFRLPKEVLLSRWRYGCKRLGIKVRYRFNQGLGLFDKKGHLLPDFSHLEGKVQVIMAAKPTPFLCITPVASIYFMRGQIRARLSASGAIGRLGMISTDTR
jgi:hypothetical protein